jgi:hypothetical protein
LASPVKPWGIVFIRSCNGGIVQISPDSLAPWSADWLWSLLLSVLAVAPQVIGLNFIRKPFDWGLVRPKGNGFSTLALLFTAGTTISVTRLRGLEASLWALAYQLLHAVPNQRTAMLYSLNAMTTFGHACMKLPDHWELMGALEALNGSILFGLSTAFLYAIIQEVWSRLASERHRKT